MRWEFRAIDENAVQNLSREAGVSPLMARLLSARGIHSAEAAHEFLSPSIAQMHSPYRMAGMAVAVERVCTAIERRERILVYGDYDVDGTTAIVVLKTAIDLCGGAGLVEFHVPHRIREGYDLRADVLERAAADGVRLVISVDSGIRAFAAAEAARRAGIDLIVTDHHLPEAAPGEVSHLPQALAVLNPNQPGCNYPCKALCGAGVAFKLAQALLEKNGRERLLPSFMKVVAIATIADAVPLTGENRAIAAIGLDGLRDPRNLGLRELMKSASIDGSRHLKSGDIAFRIAPRLNAAGRMDVARDVVELFSVRDEARAHELATKLNQLNSDRQAEEQRIVGQIERQMAETAETDRPFCLIIAGDGWHRGVLGIAATRVVERYCRPTLVASCDESGQAHGSGRSIRGFHLLEALESCRDLFTRFGGHAYAVGFSLPGANVEELGRRLDAFARARLTAENFEPVLEVDAMVAMNAINSKLVDELRRLEPFGVANPEPRFAVRGTRVLTPPRLLKEKHLKLKLACEQHGNGHFVRGLDALGWRMGQRINEIVLGDAVDAAFTIEQNTNPEFGGLQLNLLDVQKAATPGVSH
ncbi:MAG TPA: single-stranded-DNA-specific exonuclease RecJ [Terriglobales bacterium]|nr:single-stranded-DNA-specific exonuclease RecJ [Terriglobales bacterium]